MNGDFLSQYADKLDAFAAFSCGVGARVDYFQGGGGNSSVKLDGTRMAIKASGYRLKDIRRDKAYALVDYAALRDFYVGHEPEQFADVEAAGSAAAKAATLTVEGLEALRPSVEAGFHALLERYVLHSHSVYANMAACAQESRAILGAVLADADYGWAWVPYTDPGARLTFVIRAAMAQAERAGGRRPALILMQNHGVIAHADEAERCLAVHEDFNRRMADYFGVAMADFPKLAVKPVSGEEDCFSSDSPWLRARLAGGTYKAAFFDENALYPDQLVFLGGILGDEGEGEAKAATLCRDGGVLYRMPRAKAQVVEETLAAVVYIVEALRAKGLSLSLMQGEGRDFIQNWESEKYRRQVGAAQDKG